MTKSRQEVYEKVAGALREVRDEGWNLEGCIILTYEDPDQADLPEAQRTPTVIQVDSQVLDAPSFEELTGQPPPEDTVTVEHTPEAEEKAKELDVDIAEVTGTGENGRVLVGDVEDYAAEQK